MSGGGAIHGLNKNIFNPMGKNRLSCWEEPPVQLGITTQVEAQVKQLLAPGGFLACDINISVLYRSTTRVTNMHKRV